MGKDSMHRILARIRQALEAAGASLARFEPGAVASSQKSHGRGPVTEADRAVNRVLHDALRGRGEGWLSEESVDDFERLKRSRVWIVDPLDGTLEFIAGIPEWCVSVGWVENGHPVAGGIYNPMTRELFLGSLETGVTYNGKPVTASGKIGLSGAMVLASRSEVQRGEWDDFKGEGFHIRPVGSVTYKLALVAAGLADATWTLSPKNEWDIAAGVALVISAGGFVECPGNPKLTFNRRVSRLPGLIAGGASLREELSQLLGSRRRIGQPLRSVEGESPLP
jgi:myo-inositol-1(or 4)-monophosphatase